MSEPKALACMYAHPSDSQWSTPAPRDGCPCLSCRCARAEAERDEARGERDHTRDWYAVRFARLRDWLQSLDIPKEKRSEFFSITAHGTATTHEPPTYAQALNIARHERDHLRATLREVVGAAREMPDAGECETTWAVDHVWCRTHSRRVFGIPGLLPPSECETGRERRRLTAALQAAEEKINEGQ